MAFVPIASIMSKRARDKRLKELSTLVDRSPFVYGNPLVGLYGYLDAPSTPAKDVVDADEIDANKEGVETSQRHPNTRPDADAAETVKSSSSSSFPSASAFDGPYASPDIAFKCKSYNVEAKVMPNASVKVRIAMQIMLATDEFDFYFPISECGDVSDVHTSIRGVNFVPSVVRRGPLEDPFIGNKGGEGGSVGESRDGTRAKSQQENRPCEEGDTMPALERSDDRRGKGDKPKRVYNRDTNGLISSSDHERFLPAEDQVQNDGKRKTAQKNSTMTNDSTIKPSIATEGKGSKVRKEEPIVYYLHFKRLGFYHAKVCHAIDAQKLTAKVNGAAAPKTLHQQQVLLGAVGSGPINTKPLEVGNVVTIIVSYTTKLIEKEPIGTRYHFFFPLSCAPIPPTSMSIEIAMKENIQRIVSLNESHSIRPYYKGDKAEVLVINDTLAADKDDTARKQAATGKPSASNGKLAKRDMLIMLEDYVFVLVIELGAAIIPQFADPMTLFILVTAAAMFLFGALTKDLDDLY